ncbi:MAG: SRPBCC family protein [Longimicrobiales bacterium]
MIRIDQHVTIAPADIVFRVASDVERWPGVLPHYRWVRFEEKHEIRRSVVEMAAWRDFPGPLRWPTWWKSRLEADPDEPVIRYHHIDGITTGMDVEWLFLPADDGTVVRIIHEWNGPGWPLIGAFAANRVIGPHFVSFIAQRTLEGVCAEAERLSALKTEARDA